MRRLSGKQIKLIAILFVCIGAVIVFLQNTAVVETKILFATLRMSMALLLMVTFILGYIVGVISMSQFRRPGPKA
jgi:uncharacterized integral membrane protein